VQKGRGKKWCAREGKPPQKAKTVLRPPQYLEVALAEKAGEEAGAV